MSLLSTFTACRPRGFAACPDGQPGPSRAWFTADRSWSGRPGIFLEVNDRTISVYMKAFIATRAEQIPGNKDSDFRDDVILAWTHAY